MIKEIKYLIEKLFYHTIAINNCYGRFGLSHKAVMKYAELKGFKLYAFVNATSPSGDIDFKKYVPYKEGDNFSIIYYYKKPSFGKGHYGDNYFLERNISRDDPDLIQVIRKLKKEANGQHADLKIVKIPKYIKWIIEEYGGLEWVAGIHKTWS